MVPAKRMDHPVDFWKPVTNFSQGGKKADLCFQKITLAVDEDRRSKDLKAV